MSCSPFVYWAQDEKHIFLKIDLKDVVNPDINILEKEIKFLSSGTGAQGLRTYAFNLDLFLQVDTNDSKIKITDNSVKLTLIKVQEEWWPRLISQLQKPPWLKIDFDRWKSEVDVADEQVSDVRDDYAELYKKLQKEEMGYRKESFKKIYLFLYNLFMFVGFLYVMAVLVINYVRDGPDFFPHTYTAVGSVVCALQLLQYLEVMHPIFGYVRGGAFMPFMQVTGRVFVIFGMLEFEPRIQKMPVVFYLFVVWSSVELIRYPYYISQLYKKDIYPLTWLRYSAWIVLYPLGFLCEAIVIFRNMIFVHTSHKWSITMPNRWNSTFDFLTLLRIYLLFLLVPGGFTLMKYMYNIRIKKLGGTEPFIKNIFGKKAK